jgi:hypothetical protein
MRVVSLLHHGSSQAGEGRRITSQQRFAEVHVGQQVVKRVGGRVKGRGCKQRASSFSPVVGGLQSQRFLAIEVMEEATLGEPDGFADVLDAHR